MICTRANLNKIFFGLFVGKQELYISQFNVQNKFAPDARASPEIRDVRNETMLSSEASRCFGDFLE